MTSLPTSLKIGVLRGLGAKPMKDQTPLKVASSFKTPKLGDLMTSRTQKETNPDYFPKRKTSLTGKLF